MTTELDDKIPATEGIKGCLALSTAHMPNNEPDFGHCRALEHEFGFVVFVRDDIEDSCPEWLQPIMNFANDKGCLLISFDRDDEKLDGFKDYDW